MLISSARRYVANQPTVFPIKKGQNTNIQFNQRKITELIHALFEVKGQTEYLRYWPELVTGDIEMLMGYVEHHQWTEVMNTLIDTGRDYPAKDDCEEQLQNPQLGLVLLALNMSYTSCRGNVKMIGPSLEGRLLVYYPHLAGITRLIENIDSAGLKYCALVNPSMQMETPGGEMSVRIEQSPGPCQ